MGATLASALSQATDGPLLSLTVVSALTGEPICKMKDRPLDTVASVLHSLEDRLGRAQPGLLIHGHKVLPPSNTLKAAGLSDGATVALLLSRTPLVLTIVGSLAEVWDAAEGRRLQTLRGHRRRINSAAGSACGSKVVTASDDQTARIWETCRWTCERTLCVQASGQWVASAALSADGALAVLALGTGSVQVWDVAAGACLRSWCCEGISGVFAAQLSPDGASVVTNGQDGVARLWDARSGALKKELMGHDGPVNSAHFVSQGARVVTASSDGTVRLWDADGVAATETLCPKSVAKTRGVLRSAAPSLDGSSLLVRWGHTAQIWGAHGQCVQVLTHPGTVASADWSSDGAYVVTGSADGVARVWSVASGRCLHALDGHDDVVICAAVAAV